ncbi:unnamed protein product [Rhizophagus irregularis]|nr:unnamed protein product [Rhizophagus irregularis]
MDLQEIKILVAIDFGTTYSSFAYVSKENPENIIINSSWPGREGCYKTPTVLKYNESYTQVISWGNSALPDYMVDNSEERSHPIKLFKLHLLNLRKKELPWMPPQLNYKKAIEDYLTQMQILIKSTLERKWPAISFPQQVGLILTIPSESPHYMKAMRECVYNAGFLTTLNSANLEFITEQEAVVLHCLSVVKDHNLHSGDSFLAISSRVHQYGSGPFLDVISDWFRTFFRRHLDRNNVRKFDLYGSLKCVVYSVEFYYKKNGILLLKKSYKISSS